MRRSARQVRAGTRVPPVSDAIGVKKRAQGREGLGAFTVERKAAPAMAGNGFGFSATAATCGPSTVGPSSSFEEPGSVLKPLVCDAQSSFLEGLE